MTSNREETPNRSVDSVDRPGITAETRQDAPIAAAKLEHAGVGRQALQDEVDFGVKVAPGCWRGGIVSATKVSSGSLLDLVLRLMHSNAL
jgi:hypothetical protein